MSTRVQNPIEKSIEAIGNEWKQFSSQEKNRLLHWQLNRENRDLVNAFLQLQITGNGEELDFFVQFKSNFDNPQQYAVALRKELVEHYTALQQVLKKGNETLEDWQVPAVDSLNSAQQVLLTTWRSFLNHYQHLFFNWVLVLTPEKINTVTNWQTWLLNTISQLPSSLKLVVLDSEEDILLTTLAHHQDKTDKGIVNACSQANMPEAMDNVLKEADDGSESSAYQQHYTKLIRLASNDGDEKEASDAAKSAYNIATQKGWFDQQVVVLLTYASLLLNQSKSEKSIAYYDKSINLCKDALEKRQSPAAAKLLLQSLTSKATAYLNHQAYQPAANTYVEAANVAHLAGDHLMCMENWRMSGYCQEQRKEKQAAQEACINALIAGEKLTADIRPSTTLPFVGQMMLRLALLPEAVIQQEMMSLVGTDWEQRLQNMTQEESAHA